MHTPNSKLADLLSDTLLKHTKGAAAKDVEKLESAVGLVVVEARDACKHKKDPNKQDGFKDAVDLVKSVATKMEKK